MSFPWDELPDTEDAVSIDDAMAELKKNADLIKAQRKKDFGHLLKSFRVREGLTVEQACDAKHLCMSVNTLKSYERGRTEPSINDLVRFAYFYRVSLDILVGISGEKGHRTINWDVEPIAFSEERLELIRKVFKITDFGDINQIADNYRKILFDYKREKNKKSK